MSPAVWPLCARAGRASPHVKAANRERLTIFMTLHSFYSTLQTPTLIRVAGVACLPRDAEVPCVSDNGPIDAHSRRIQTARRIKHNQLSRPQLRPALAHATPHSCRSRNETVTATTGSATVSQHSR